MNTHTRFKPFNLSLDCSSESQNKTNGLNHDSVKLNPDGSFTTYRQRSKGCNARGGLSLLDATNYHRPKRDATRRGLNGIPAAARSAVRNSVAVFLDSIDPRTAGFLTLTLPGASHGLTANDVVTCNENWGELTRQFHQQLQRYLESHTLPSLYVSVTEVQPKRFIEKGQVALHLHTVIPLRAHYWSRWAHVPCDIRRIWAQVLEALVGHPVDTSAAVNIREIKSADAVARYIGKYMTKGGNLLRDIIRQGLQSQIPKSWFSRSHSLVAMVRSATVYLTGPAAAEFVRDMARMESDGIISYHPVEVAIADKNTGELSNILMAYSGWFYDRSTMRAYKSHNGIREQEQQPIWEINPVPFSVT